MLNLKNMKNSTVCHLKAIVFTLILFFVLPSSVFAMSGLELAQKVYDRDDGNDSYFKTKMVLIDKNGNRRERLFESYAKDYDGLTRTFLEFLDPPDIKGTKFLSWENANKDDTQYLYLPELGRARRIVSNQKKLHFVNTDFTYEDMQRRKPEDDVHTILEQKTYFDRLVYVLQSIPKEGTSQYGKRVSLIESDSFVPVAIDYFNKKYRKIKEFRVYDLQKIDGIWTTMKVEMNDLKTGHRTRMSIQSVKYNQGIDDKIFELRNLEQ